MLGSGVSRVDLFGTEVVHDHSVGVSCKCTVERKMAQERRLLKKAPYSGALPKATHPNHKGRHTPRVF